MLPTSFAPLPKKHNELDLAIPASIGCSQGYPI